MFRAAAIGDGEYRTWLSRQTATSAQSGAGTHYLSFVLAEGVKYLDRLTYGPTRFGAGAPTRLPEIIVYLLFHLGEKAKALIASAAAHALLARSKSPYAVNLRAALTNNGLTPAIQELLDGVSGASSLVSVTRARHAWPTITAVLGKEPVLSALAEYLRNENEDVWHTWVHSADPANPSSPRGNCIGYAQLYEYLLAEIAHG